MQLAAGSKPIVLTLASFAVTRKAYGKVRQFDFNFSLAEPHTL